MEVGSWLVVVGGELVRFAKTVMWLDLLPVKMIVRLR